jgi:hypothetical protein
MNKARRHELKMLKFMRRLKNYGLDITHNELRTTGKPCSCALCSPAKWKSNGLKKIENQELRFQIEQA